MLSTKSSSAEEKALIVVNVVGLLAAVKVSPCQRTIGTMGTSFMLSYVSCISTSERVLRMPFAGQNKLLTLKPLFPYKL